MNKKTKIQNIINEASVMLENNQNTFRHIFNNFVNKCPNTKAFIIHNKDNSTKEFTYLDYKDRVKHMANKLAVLLKSTEKNSIVAIKLSNSPTWCFTFWATLMSHHRPLLIDAKLPYENTKKILESVKAAAIINEDDRDYEDVLTISKETVNDTSEGPNFVEVWSDEVIFCSSGTTGDIKLMIFNGNNMLNQLNASKEMPLENLDIIYPQTLSPLRLVALIPFHHIFAFVAIFLWYSFYNSTLVFTEFNDPITLVKDIRDYKVTHIYHVPLFYDVVVKNFINKLDEKNKKIVNKVMDYNLGNISFAKAGLLVKLYEKKIKEKIFGKQIKYLISGGGFLNENTSKTINALGYPLYNGYGMTEIGVTSVELSKDIDERVKRSIGHPLHNVVYKLNKKNELLIKSPTIHIKEIINGIEKDTILDKEGYFNSNDIATVDKNNKYYLKGRSKDVIITSNGENVYPDEIEFYFKDVPNVTNLAVFGHRNKIILVAEANNKSVLDKLEEINKNLPIHKQVNEILISYEPLPLSSSLKVKRYLVKEYYLNGKYKNTKTKKKDKIDILFGYDESTKKVVVSRLQAVFQEILFLKKEVDGTAHWINDLHSDSMTYVTLISEIEKEFNIKIPIDKYGKLTCLNEFAKEILDSNCK